MEISGQTFKGLADSAERLIGYLYAGVLPLAILAVEKPDFVKQVVGATSGLLAVIIAISLGIGIYTLHFRVFGELLIYPFQHIVHIIIDKVLLRRTPERSSSTMRILHDLDVPRVM